MITADPNFLSLQKSGRSYKNGDEGDQTDPQIRNDCNNVNKSWPQIKQVLEKIISDASLKHEESVRQNGDAAKSTEQKKCVSPTAQGSPPKVHEDLFFENEVFRELTLGYVRVRELQRDIERAKKILTKMVLAKTSDEKKVVIEDLKEKVKLLFHDRAQMALSHARWRMMKHEQKIRGCGKLVRLKSRADVIERKHFQLKKQLLGLQALEVPKKNSSFFARLFTSCCRNK
ncbi:uncharacterized protein LOC106664670 [Cimex lectularius]|uniref:Uncharacterized protein n=1 Tax=Cimex lectularius TaxID=79782 RepID=A0A8I6RME2_CIMLE|nr:uncharacterized protein LOC106664670 [Cimex lectularius]